MKTYYQPSGVQDGLDFLICDNWIAQQALAVVELLDDLRGRILVHYQLSIGELMRELHGFPEDEDQNLQIPWDDTEEIPF